MGDPPGGRSKKPPHALSRAYFDLFKTDQDHFSSLDTDLTRNTRAKHAHPTSPRSTGFCAIWDCISSSCKGKNSQWFSSVAVALLQQEINKTSGEIYSTDE